jgi:hypothetical protein
VTQQTSFFGLGGGMDLITPAVQLPPGRVIAALNYEPIGAGYRRLRGFERFDGQAAPSDVTGYSVLHFTSGDTDLSSVVAGAFLWGAGTSWRGRAIAAPVITSGSAAAGTAVGYIGVSTVSAAPTPSGNLRVGPPTGMNAQFGAYSSIVANEAVPEATGGAWLAAAVAARRLGIEAVPGSGPVRGVWLIAANVVAVRDNSGATAGAVHRQSTNPNTSWAAVALSTQFTFNSGGSSGITLDYALTKNLRVTGETSGAFGALRGFTIASGTWAGGDAAGTIVVSSITGTFQSGETVKILDSPSEYLDVLTLTNAGTVYSLPAGGEYSFITHNFFGVSDLLRTYGVNGVGKAFEYDTTADILSPILTGMTVDTPTHLAAHRGSLFLSFPGGSLQFSTVGNPLSFDAVVGAGEIGMGSDITALIPATQGALAILAENSIGVLYGNDSADYQLEVLTDEAGAKAHTAQKVGQVYYMDNRGVRSLAASAAYGNFRLGAVSELIEPLLKDFTRDGVEPVASLVCRTAGQLWYFFDNGTGIIIYFGGKTPSILPFDLGKVVTCACSVEDAGEERLFIGCSDGFVYELNKGTSFDGAVIEHYLRLPFNHFGNPQLLKRLHKVTVDLEASGTTTLNVSADLDYGAEAGVSAQELVVTTGGGAIDDLGSNELYYASQIETQAEAWIDGTCRNVSLKIGGSTSAEEPHTLTGVTYHISPRGMRR